MSSKTFSTDEIQNYPPEVYEFLSMLDDESSTPIPINWHSTALKCEHLGLLWIDGVDDEDAELLGAKHFANRTEKGLTALMLGPRDRPDSALWLGNGIVKVSDKLQKLPGHEAAVLQALVEAGGTSDKPNLYRHSKVEDVVGVMRKLKNRFPQHVFCPGGRGKGGYSTTIRAAQ